MTIASQISRLQTDKECIRQAIIDKGVDVAVGVSLDDYAACVAAIETTAKMYAPQIILVWGWGGGGNWACCSWGWGGGWGQVIVCRMPDVLKEYPVYIWCWVSYNTNWNPSCIVGSYTTLACGGCWGSGSKGGNSWSGCIWGCLTNVNCKSSWGGAWATANGGNNSWTSGWAWGAGLCCYGGWGWGGNVYTATPWSWKDGGWKWACNGVWWNATCYWWWGWGWSQNRCWWCGCQWVAIFCYLTDGSDWITCATWGTKTTSWSYTIHTFTADGTFCIVS